MRAVSASLCHGAGGSVVPSGVVTNQAISSLGFLSGMTLCYDQPYGHATTDAELAKCASQGSQAFVAGTHGSSVVVGAGGETSCVFQFGVGKYHTSAQLCNGAYWYNVQGWSFGFAPLSSVYLWTCDMNSVSDATRLCWHLGGAGGWRVGSVNFYNSEYNTAYRKRIWVASITTASPSYAGMPSQDRTVTSTCAHAARAAAPP